MHNGNDIYDGSGLGDESEADSWRDHQEKNDETMLESPEIIKLIIKLIRPMPPTIDSDGATIEAMLEPLIRDHGYETVRDHLERLFGSAKWADCQRVDSIARRLDRRIHGSPSESLIITP